MILDHKGNAIELTPDGYRQLNINQYLAWLTSEPTSRYISPKRSLSLSTVYSCIKLLADSVAMTPLKFYEKAPRAREREEITRGPFANIARDACPLFNNFTFWQAMLTSLSGWGNGYASIIREDGVPRMLIYLAPDQVSYQDTSGDPRFEFLRGETPYVYQVSTGLQTTFVRPNDMIHIASFTYDGIQGISPVTLHQDTMQVENEQTNYGRSFYSTGGKISGVIESPRQTSRADSKEFVTWFNEFYGGSPSQGGAGRIAFLPNGMTFKPASVVNPQDAEWVKARELTRKEIASIYRVPAYLLGDLERATWNNVTQLSEEFVRYTLTPLYSVIETELNRKLLDNSNRFFYEFDPSVLLRGTVGERYSNYATGINSGFLSPAEVREKEGLPFVEELDYFLRMPGSEAVGEEGEDDRQENDITPDEEARMQKLIDANTEFRNRQQELNYELRLEIEKVKFENADLARKNALLTEELTELRKRNLEAGSLKSEVEKLSLLVEIVQERQENFNNSIKDNTDGVASCLDLIEELTEKPKEEIE